MLEIKKTDLNDGLNLLFNAPQLNNLDSKEELNNILLSLLNDVYIDEPEELILNFRNEPSDKITQTLFLNYGILPEYYEKLNPLIKRKLIYYLEILFQQKGSIKNLEIISELFSNFFKDINYYGISVNKLPIDNSQKYILNYFLKPLVISKPEVLKYFPTFKIDITGKYLMKLEQFENFQIFPIDTNLLYVDFIDSSHLLHSDSFFINGALAYTMTKFQDTVISFDQDYNLKMLDELYFQDIHIILTYFNIRFLACTGNELLNMDYDPSIPTSTSLIFKPEMLETIEILLLEYKNLKNRSAKKLKDLSRRWQFLLQSNYNDEVMYSNFEELELFISKKYPKFKELFDSFENSPGIYSGIKIDNLLPEEINEVIKTDYVNYLMNLYINLLNNITGNDFIELTINGLFQNILNSNTFIEYFFEPVFKLFVNYFIPGNMDFIISTSSKTIIKDKFEAVFIDNQMSVNIYNTHIDMRYLPGNRIEIKPFVKEKSFSKIKADERWLNINTNKISKSLTRLNEYKISSEIGLYTQTSYNNYRLENLKRLTVTKQKKDEFKIEDEYTIDQLKYNFFKDFNTSREIDNYIWKLERLNGITTITSEDEFGYYGNSSIGILEDFLFLKKNKYKNIENYLFYKS